MNTTANLAPTYSAKVINRLDRVMFVLAILVSAILFLEGTTVNQNMAAGSDPSFTQVTQLDNMAHTSYQGAGGSLAATHANNTGAGLGSQGGGA